MILINKEDGTEYECTPTVLRYKRDGDVINDLDASEELYVLTSIKKPRWRAEKDSDYYIILTEMDVTKINEYLSDTDSDLYNAGNYFETKEQAESAAKALKAVLAYIHNEGEHQAMVGAIDEAREACNE